MKRIAFFLILICVVAGISCCSEMPPAVSESVPDDSTSVAVTSSPMPSPTATPTPTPMPTEVPTPTVTPKPTAAVQGSIPYHTRSFADEVTLHIFLWGSKDENRYKEVLATMREVGYIYEPEENADISLTYGGITLFIGDGWQGRGINWSLRYRGEPCYVHIATLTEAESSDAAENLHCYFDGKSQHTVPLETALDNGYIRSQKQFMGETVEVWELDPFEHNDTYYMWFMPDERHIVSITCYLKTAEEREEMLQQLKLIRYML